MRQGTIPFRCDIEPAPFNFSRQVNRGIALADRRAVLLLNNDIEIVDGDWLREMVSCFRYPGTGIVGARLLLSKRAASACRCDRRPGRIRRSLVRRRTCQIIRARWRGCTCGNR